MNEKKNRITTNKGIAEDLNLGFYLYLYTNTVLDVTSVCPSVRSL